MLLHCGTQNIVANDLLLRPFQHSDDDAMLKYWVSDPNIQSLYSEPIYTTKEEVGGLLNTYINNYNKQDYYRWAIIEKTIQACIGQVAIFLVDSKNHFGEIEYCIGSQFQRRGYATQAVKAVLEFSFKNVRFHKIQVCHKEFNTASKGVIQNCGFTYEGTLRDYFYMDGKYVNRLYYSMLYDEWEKIVCNKKQCSS